MLRLTSLCRMQATYTGSLRNALVTFVCNQSAVTPFMTAQGEKQPLNYAMAVTTVCACPNGCAGGGGGGKNTTTCSLIDPATHAV
jgi:iron only hydrogenase large subunit-like protein